MRCEFHSSHTHYVRNKLAKRLQSHHIHVCFLNIMFSLRRLSFEKAFLQMCEDVFIQLKEHYVRVWSVFQYTLNMFFRVQVMDLCLCLSTKYKCQFWFICSFRQKIKQLVQAAYKQNIFILFSKRKHFVSLSLYLTLTNDQLNNDHEGPSVRLRL